MNVDDLLALRGQPPKVTPSEAEAVARTLYGLTARATALDGERDRNFRLDTSDGSRLVLKFIDPEADFVFASPKEFPVDAVPFDAAGVEFGHQGEDCTFETLLRRCGLEDQRLAQLAEIVHEIDLRDQKFARDEARGIDLALRGLLATFKDDQEVLAHGMTLFDGLYAALNDRP